MEQKPSTIIEARVATLTECIEHLVRLRDHVARRQPMPAAMIENGIERLAGTLCLVIHMKPVTV